MLNNFISHQLSLGRCKWKPQWFSTRHTSKAKILKTDNNKFWVGCKLTIYLRYYWWEYKMVHTLWKTYWHFPRKLNTHLPYDSVILILCIKKKKDIYPHEDLYTDVHCNFINNRQNSEESKAHQQWNVVQ